MYMEVLARETKPVELANGPERVHIPPLIIGPQLENLEEEDNKLHIEL